MVNLSSLKEFYVWAYQEVGSFYSIGMPCVFIVFVSSIVCGNQVKMGGCILF